MRLCECEIQNSNWGPGDHETIWTNCCVSWLFVKMVLLMFPGVETAAPPNLRPSAAKRGGVDSSGSLSAPSVQLGVKRVRGAGRAALFRRPRPNRAGGRVKRRVLAPLATPAPNQALFWGGPTTGNWAAGGIDPNAGCGATAVPVPVQRAQGRVPAKGALTL
jgi:hypothetical protein